MRKFVPIVIAGVVSLAGAAILLYKFNDKVEETVDAAVTKLKRIARGSSDTELDELGEYLMDTFDA